MYLLTASQTPYMFEKMAIAGLCGNELILTSI